MADRKVNRWSFAMNLASMALAWVAEATDPSSPGGGDIETEEYYGLVARMLSLLGVTVDPEELQERLKGLF